MAERPKRYEDAEDERLVGVGAPVPVPATGPNSEPPGAVADWPWSAAVAFDRIPVLVADWPWSADVVFNPTPVLVADWT